ncbi:MAG: PAS domain-containing protein [Thermoplasmata archaeon]|nr:PAS domain-containing protein [Thermoplasmata archaeon]
MHALLDSGANMDSDVTKQELYTEKLMNMILDAVDDIIIIHDSQHTIIWMNRAAEKAFGKPSDEVIGTKCYSLFGNTVSCSDCTVNVTNVGSPSNAVRRRIIPGTEVTCDCSTIPYYEGGKLKLVVQHLRPVQCPVGN